MTFLAPGYLFASIAVAAVIVGLHFIVTQQPRASILPTARFVPDTRATTIAPANWPSDLLLLLLRLLTILAAGTALARPVLRPGRQPSARVVLVDVSRAAMDSVAFRDSVRANYRQGDALAVFDSVARVVTGNVGDSIAHLAPTQRRGNLGAALISAMRAGSTLRDRADSLDLVIVSPFAREELNAATDSIRRLWTGRARLVRAGMTASTNGQPIPPGRIAVSAGNDDPLA
ncbi:MAG TPA: BatA domain-containing protein, partial [Gemmatimonadaceae bacterium]|nr:BatA domain-containing protein [Gemmatimonadaceae bacterium]